MKGTFISSDYVFDFDGTSRLIELNTDTSIISSSLNTEHFSCDDFISVLNENSISKTRRKEQVRNRIKILFSNFRFGFYPIYGLIRNIIIFFIPLFVLNLIKRTVWSN